VPEIVATELNQINVVLPEYPHVLVDPRPPDCDFESAPRGDKYCDYETVTDSGRDECAWPECGVTIHVSWHKVETGTLNGQVLATSEIGNLYPAKHVKGYLISCEPPPNLLFTVFRESPTDACEYSCRGVTRWSGGGAER